MNYDLIIQKAAEFVRDFMQEHENFNLYYHKLVHTERVVTIVNEIAHHYRLNDRDFFVCTIAAWFHDIGYYENGTINHEKVSARQAEDFLLKYDVAEDIIKAIKNCILATRIPQNSVNLLEQIVSDANLYHLGTDEFFDEDKLIKKEVQALNHITIDKDEWLSSSLHLLKGHHFQTEYCRKLLEKKERQNLHRLKRKMGNRHWKQSPIDLLLQEHTKNIRDYEDNVSTDIPEQPERGTETLFRIASGISQRLNEQADTKAHILISVNSVIISVFLSVVVRRMETHTYLTLPVIMFLVVNLLTIVFSILATRPSVPNGMFDNKDFKEKKVNLLFFGSFYRMDFEDYSKSIFRIIGDKHHLYLSLIRNLYDQGIVLGKKYRLLKSAYNVFMFGIVVSVIAFVVASRFFVP